jgi:hypothetical protein
MHIYFYVASSLRIDLAVAHLRRAIGLTSRLLTVGFTELRKTVTNLGHVKAKIS